MGETQIIVAENIIEKTSDGYTALHYATLMNDFEIATVLIEAGVEIDAQEDNSNTTALHIAVLLNHFEIGKLIVEADADLNKMCKCTKSQFTFTALEIAETKKYFAFAKMLRKNS